MSDWKCFVIFFLCLDYLYLSCYSMFLSLVCVSVLNSIHSCIAIPFSIFGFYQIVICTLQISCKIYHEFILSRTQAHQMSMKAVVPDAIVYLRGDSASVSTAGMLVLRQPSSKGLGGEGGLLGAAKWSRAHVRGSGTIGMLQVPVHSVHVPQVQVRNTFTFYITHVRLL